MYEYEIRHTILHVKCMYEYEIRHTILHVKMAGSLLLEAAQTSLSNRFLAVTYDNMLYFSRIVRPCFMINRFACVEQNAKKV